MKNLVGRTFGRLKVIEYKGVDKHHKRLWLCECSCEDKSVIIASTSQLTTGHTQSCGCLRKERTSKANKKYNNYDLSGEYGIGYTSKGERFYFDLEDYDKIKKYCWSVDGHGYFIAPDKNNPSKNIILHRLIMNCGEKDVVVDHIKHKTYDNRKSQLRVCSDSQNNMNHLKRKDNTSGITGVYLDKRTNQWYAQIKVKNKKRITLGYFSDINDAIKARKNAEEKYFGMYSYDNSMNMEE